MYYIQEVPNDSNEYENSGKSTTDGTDDTEDRSIVSVIRVNIVTPKFMKKQL